MPLKADIIQDYLAKQDIKIEYRIDVLPSVTSTNDYLAEHGHACVEKVVVCIADRQTQGRGRFGHRWWSPPGVNLYMSMQWDLQIWKKRYEVLGLWLLIAIAELLENLGVAGVKLKWPNDICAGEKKLGGVLIERKTNQMHNRLVIGVGLNVAMSLVEDLNEKPGWTDLISAHPEWSLCRNELTACVIGTLTQVLDTLDVKDPDALLSAWSRYDLMGNQKVEFLYQNRRMKGIAQGIDSEGRLLMHVGGKRLHLHSAHVQELRL